MYSRSQKSHYISNIQHNIILLSKIPHVRFLCERNSQYSGIGQPHVETVVLLNNKFAKARDFVQIGIDAEEYYKIKDEDK